MVQQWREESPEGYDEEVMAVLRQEMPYKFEDPEHGPLHPAVEGHLVCSRCRGMLCERCRDRFDAVLRRGMPRKSEESPNE